MIHIRFWHIDNIYKIKMYIEQKCNYKYARNYRKRKPVKALVKRNSRKLKSSGTE